MYLHNYTFLTMICALVGLLHLIYHQLIVYHEIVINHFQLGCNKVQMIIIISVTYFNLFNVVVNCNNSYQGKTHCRSGILLKKSSKDISPEMGSL